MAKVLVIEDDEVSARCLRVCLERSGGHEVRVSVDPQEALELATQRWPNLILMDVSLGGAQLDGALTDGIALTRRIIALPQTDHIAVVLLTAHAMAGDRERLLQESGADDYVAKPIGDYRAFLEQMRGFLERS
jgi:CheY-like chemotaxis protein